MRRIIALVGLFALLLQHAAVGQTSKPELAQKILQEAIKNAQSSNRNVFLIFHASYCGWCRRLDKALEDADIKKIIDASYVVTHLDVRESKGKIDSLENPGGVKIMNDFGGEKSGLPFFVFIDGNGKKIADSKVMPNNENIGYPATKEEIAEFEKLLKKTALHMTDTQREQVIAYLIKNAPKQ